MDKKEELLKLLEQGMSLMEICELYNLNYANTYYFCKKNGFALSRKSNGKSKTTLKSRLKSRKINISELEKIKELYLVDDMTSKSIAKMYKVSQVTLLEFMRTNGIPIKLKNGKYEKRTPIFSKNQLEALYFEENLSLFEIAERLGYPNSASVAEDFKIYNIERRSYKEAGQLLYAKRPEKRELHRQQFYTGITGPKTTKISSLEKKFIEWAISQSVEYVHQFQIRSTWHRYDFLIKNTNVIVEMDGDFWHSKPDHVLRDSKFDDTARRHGYIVIRIRESELNNNSNIFNERLLELITKGEQHAN